MKSMFEHPEVLSLSCFSVELLMSLHNYYSNAVILTISCKSPQATANGTPLLPRERPPGRLATTSSPTLAWCYYAAFMLSWKIYIIPGLMYSLAKWNCSGLISGALINIGSMVLSFRLGFHSFCQISSKVVSYYTYLSCTIS
jgi:hypothetical protein